MANILNAGKLRHRVVIQRPDYVQDTQTGAVTPNWVNVATVWCAIEPISAREFVVANTEDSKVVARITMRYRNDFDYSCRLYHAAKELYYNIEGILSDKDSGLEYITLPVSEGVRYNTDDPPVQGSAFSSAFSEAFA